MYSETFNGTLLDTWMDGKQMQHRMESYWTNGWMEYKFNMERGKITVGISDLNTEYMCITAFVDSSNFAINCHYLPHQRSRS